MGRDGVVQCVCKKEERREKNGGLYFHLFLTLLSFSPSLFSPSKSLQPTPKQKQQHLDLRLRARRVRGPAPARRPQPPRESRARRRTRLSRSRLCRKHHRLWRQPPGGRRRQLGCRERKTAAFFVQALFFFEQQHAVVGCRGRDHRRSGGRVCCRRRLGLGFEGAPGGALGGRARRGEGRDYFVFFALRHVLKFPSPS